MSYQASLEQGNALTGTLENALSLLSKHITGGNGMLSNDGIYFKAQRKFGLTTLRKYDDSIFQCNFPE